MIINKIFLLALISVLPLNSMEQRRVENTQPCSSCCSRCCQYMLELLEEPIQMPDFSVIFSEYRTRFFCIHSVGVAQGPCHK